MPTIHFSQANLWVEITGTPEPLGSDRFLLAYRTPGAASQPRVGIAQDGQWTLGGAITTQAAPKTLNPNPTQGPRVERLILTGLAGGGFAVVEGALKVRPDEESVGAFLGETLQPNTAAQMWLTHEGVVIGVSAAKALPGVAEDLGATGDLPALFRWFPVAGAALGGEWHWRLLSRWPIKGPGDEGTDSFRELPDLLGKVFEGITRYLPFVEPPALRSELRLAGEDQPFGEQRTAPGIVRWTSFRSEAADDGSPWWQAGLAVCQVRLRSAPQGDAGRGVLDEQPGIELLELRPDELSLRGTDAGSEYVFIERRNRTGAAPEVAADVVVDLLEWEQARGKLAATLVHGGGGAREIARSMVMLPTEEPGAVTAPAQVWLREPEGFACFASPGPAGRAAAWPESNITRETRDVKLSLWLDERTHANVPFFDLSLLLDNCEHIELAFTVGAAGGASAQLRIWDPALRFTLGRHATHGHGQARADRPPHEPAAGGSPVFKPLVFLSAKMVKGAAAAPFAGGLYVETDGRLAVRLPAGANLTRWRRPQAHAVAAPLEWAINDPGAAHAPSALRGLVPTVAPTGGVTLIPERGGISAETGVEGIPAEFAGATLAFVGATEAHYEIGFPTAAGAEPFSTVEFRRRGAPAALDTHWVRSVPPARDAVEQVPVELTWLSQRILKSAPLAAGALFDDALTTQINLLAGAPDPAKLQPRTDAWEMHRIVATSANPAGSADLFYVLLQRDGTTIHRWTLVPADDFDRLHLGGLNVTPVAFSETALELQIIAPDEHLDRFSPFAGPGRLKLPLQRVGEVYEVQLAGVAGGVVEGRIILSDVALFGALRARTNRSALQAVDSTAVSLKLLEPAAPGEAREVALHLEKVRYWFEKDAEIFSVESDQSITLKYRPGQSEGPMEDFEAEVEYPEDPQPAQLYEVDGEPLFYVEQVLPGLRVVERLIHPDAPVDGPRFLLAPAPGDPPPATDDFAAVLPVAIARVGDGYECVFAGATPYPAGTFAGAQLPIELRELTRIFLRIERNRAVSASSLEPYVIESGMIGWNSGRVFDLPTAEPGLQLTLRYGAEGGARTLKAALNGIVRIESSPPGAGNAKLTGDVVFWDAVLPVAFRAGSGLSLELSAGETGLAVPALLAAAFSFQSKEIRWCAFCTPRIAIDGGSPAKLVLTGVFSLEPIRKQRATGLAFRRPQTKLQLWDAPLPVGQMFNKGVVVSLRLAPGEPLPNVVVKGKFTMPVSDWRTFYFGPTAERASREEDTSVFPQEPFRGLEPSLNGIAIYGDFNASADAQGDQALVAHTLFTENDETFWLQSPIRKVTPAADPSTARPCLWIWDAETNRMRKLWIFEPTAELRTAPSGDSLSRLAQRVLTFSRWRRGAVVEITARITGASNPPPATPGPIVITTAEPHSFTKGDRVSISGVRGNTAANGLWTISDATPTTFTLEGSTANAAYSSGGLAMMWRLLDSPLLNRSIELSAVTRSNDPTGQPRFAKADPAWATLLVGGWTPDILKDGAAALRLAGNQVEQGKRGAAGGMVAPHLLARVEVTIPPAAAPALEEVRLTLGRAVPFALDGLPKERPYYPWPIQPWTIRAADEPPAGASVPHAPHRVPLSLYTPRPGEIVAHRVTVSAKVKDGTYLSDALHFGARTPLGDNPEVGAKLSASGPLPIAASKFRDHRETRRIEWERQHPDRRTARPGRPAFVFHSPEIEKRLSPGESIWFRAAVDPQDLEAPNTRILALLKPTLPAPADASVTLRLQVDNDAPSEVAGARFVVLLASNVPGEVGLAGRNLRLTLLSVQPGQWSSAWSLSLHRQAEATGAGVPLLAQAASAPLDPWLVEAWGVKEEFTFGNTSVSRAAGPMPALLSLIRTTAGAAPKLAGFGPDAAGWEPHGDGQSVGWIRRGGFLDTIPPGNDGLQYELVVLQGDGTVQRIPQS